MITVKITRTIPVEYEETQNFVTKKTYVKDKEDSYGNKTPIFNEESAPSVAKRTKWDTVSILEQNIEDESKFDLAAVIRAVNSL